MDEKFIMFMETVDGKFRDFVSQIDQYLTANGCKCDIKLQKSGYVVSYVKRRQKDTGNICIPQIRDEASHLSRAYTGIPELP